VTFILIIFLGGAYWGFTRLTEDDYVLIEQEIEETRAFSIRSPHIEIIDDTYAIVFYDVKGSQIFGMLELEKSFFKWKVTGAENIMSSSSKGDLYVQHALLPHVSVVKGLYENVDRVIIRTKEEEEYEAKTVDREEGLNLWYVASTDEDFLEVTVIAFDKHGDVLHEIALEEEPNEFLRDTEN
jgi:hypothetical protein